MPQLNHTSVVLITEAADAAAEQIRSSWDAGAAVFVLDDRLPKRLADQLVREVAPTLRAQGSEFIPLDGQPRGERLAAIVSTSGSSGAPKLVDHSFATLTTNTRMNSQALDLTQIEPTVIALPLSSVAGLASFARSWVSKTETHFVSPAVLLDVGKRARGAVTSVVPTILKRWIEGEVPIEDFHTILVGGGRIDPTLMNDARGRGANIHATYGLTETFGGVIHDGAPLPQVEMRLTALGELLIKTPTLCVSTNEANYQDRITDGWLHTGDFGVVENGLLISVERMDDMIISGGINVSPDQVETTLQKHPAIDDVCVIGLPDQDWGQVVTAVIAGAPSLTLDELRDWAKRKLPVACVPKKLIKTPSIPRTPTGKLSRKLVRDTVYRDH